MTSNDNCKKCMWWCEFFLHIYDKEREKKFEEGDICLTHMVWISCRFGKKTGHYCKALILLLYKSMISIS